MRLRIDEPTPSYGDCTPEEATVLHIHELKNDGTFIMETLMEASGDGKPAWAASVRYAVPLSDLQNMESLEGYPARATSLCCQAWALFLSGTTTLHLTRGGKHAGLIAFG